MCFNSGTRCLAFGLTKIGQDMLQKLEFEDDAQELDRSYLLKPAFYLEIARRRWLHFLLPFVLIASGGLAVARLWPAAYLSEGRILVESQQIPIDLVRPTVTTAAEERIQVIQQRTMTRDNLIAISDKFDLFPKKRQFMTAGEIVDLMKKSTLFAPVETQLDFKQTSSRNPTIVFSVGFEYGDPKVAAQVANELITRILDEDLRDRTNRASDTTKFLTREVEKLQSEIDALDAKIAQLKLVQLKSAQEKAEQERLIDKPDRPAGQLAQLKTELAQKSSLYSDKHPLMRSLKAQIAALERQISSSTKSVPSVPSPSARTEVTETATLEALEAQQETLQKNLDAASTKLAAARVGENLEKNQQSEKLDLIEQPTVPQLPAKPNRLKLAAIALLLAAGAGAALAFVAELADKAIRRSSDIFGAVDRNLVVAIPYISTQVEVRHRKLMIVYLAIGLLVLVIAAIAAAYLFLPLDLMVAKLWVGLVR